MKNKRNTFEESDIACIASEPAVVYLRTSTWNPNVPFSGVQDDWWEHFMQIENGQFYSLEEANREFDVWKQEYLAKKL